MNYNKESLTKLLLLVKEISNVPENEWFKEEIANLSAKIDETTHSSDNLVDIKKDTNKIVYLLEINPDCSVDYSFVEHKLLRTRLELDNLRMENIRYNLKEKDEMKRLYDFCINAFYQIENLINYFYYEKYSNIETLLNHLESIPKTKFKRQKEKDIGDITIATKIYSFNMTYFNNGQGFTGYNIDSLRQIRNEGLHRCTRMKNSANEEERLHKFLKYATFNSVHSLVNSLSLKIGDLLKVV